MAYGEPITVREDRLDDALTQIEQWCKAYPVEMFKPLSDDQIDIASMALADYGIDMGALHGQWARHILSGIADIIAKAREE